MIEDESEQRFRDAVPLEWVVRRLSPDYGIDLTTEIFDAAGHSTPYSFHVQLKATDEEDVSRALRSIRFPRELANYYWSLPIPVLIVRYHAPSQKLYARWFHGYNPLVAAHPDEPSDAEPTKTVGFVFTEHGSWTAQTPDDLVHAVQSFRRFRSPDLQLPLKFSVSGDADGLASRLLALRRALATVGDTVTVRPGAPGPDRPHIVIQESASTAALADVASVTLDHEDGERDLDVAAANLGCAIALLLCTVGQPNLASQVAAACGPASTAITGMHMAFTLAVAFFKAGRIPEALTLTAELIKRDDEEARVAASILQTAVLARSRLTDHESDLAVEVARFSLDTVLASGDRFAASGYAYNLGKALSRRGDWTLALSAFRQAAELSPSYEDRAYFWRDLGAALFESGDYSGAVDAYEHAIAIAIAIAIEDDGWTSPRLADALMFAGRYADAQARFAEFLHDGGAPRDTMWRLKLRVLADLRSLVGDTQGRRPDEANELAELVDFDDPNLTLDQARVLVQQAIDADACSGAAHNRRMFLSFREDATGEIDASDAVGPAIAAAVLHHGDVDAWVNAVTLAAHENEPDPDLYDLMRTAIRTTGDEVIDRLLTATPPLDQARVVLLDRAAQDLEEERRNEAFTMRLSSDDGVVTEFEFLPRDPDDQQ